MPNQHTCVARGLGTSFLKGLWQIHRELPSLGVPTCRECRENPNWSGTQFFRGLRTSPLKATGLTKTAFPRWLACESYRDIAKHDMGWRQPWVPPCTEYGQLGGLSLEKLTFRCCMYIYIYIYIYICIKRCGRLSI